MKSGKAAGDDGFNLEMIKNNVSSLAQPLTHIYNLSIFSGKVPQAFKLAKVIPIYKKDNEQFLNNYRPISFLSIFNKILEKLIVKLYMLFLTLNMFFISINLDFAKIIVLS